MTFLLFQRFSGNIRASLLLILFGTCLCAPSESPCTDVLTYNQTSGQSDRWYATITLAATENLAGIWLDIELDRKAHLLGNDLGEVESTDNQRFIIKDLKKKIANGTTSSVVFFVKHNEAERIPVITAIRWNGREICLADAATTAPVVTDVSVSAVVPTVLPAENAPPSIDQRLQSVEPIVISPIVNPLTPIRETISTNFGAATTSAPNLPQPVWNAGGYAVSDKDDDSSADYFIGDQWQPAPGVGTPGLNCGTVIEAPGPLTATGQAPRQNLWPWHASLYHYRNRKHRYICGGTLVSSTVILTAAHCVTKRTSSGAIDPLTLKIFLAKQSISSFHGVEQTVAVSEIIVPKNFTNDNLYADIAILKLTKPVTMTNLVRPACLWDKNRESLQTVIGREGAVAGWEFNRHGKTNTNLTQVRMNVVDHDSCRNYFRNLITDLTFCAGFKNGSGICNGDSGSGMVLNEAGPGESPIWKLRGIISLGVALKNNYVCDINNYVVFTDVAKFTSWIEQNS